MLNWLKDTHQLLNPTCTKDRGGGYTRLAFSMEEQAAMQAFINVARTLQLTISKDAIGNVIAQYEGLKPELPPIAFGSHLDTVKNGGAFDGVAGVLAGLGVVKYLQDTGYHPDRSIEVICFIAEESARFGVSTIGSKATAGLLSIDELQELADDQKVTLFEALQSLDLHPQNVKAMDWKQKELHSFIELHIEQGPILKEENKQLGIVTGISSPLRYQLSLHGEANHTGTTLMGRRKDALAAAARCITFIEAMGMNMAEKDHFVATVSIANVLPNNMNVIPETVTLGIDIRSTNEQLLYESAELLEAYCSTLANSTGVTTNLLQLSKEEPVFMDFGITEQLAKAAGKTNKSYQFMASGAGHDVMNMAKRWPSGLLFIPCNGISHNPKEYTEMTNILNGIEVLVNYIQLVHAKEQAKR